MKPRTFIIFIAILTIFSALLFAEPPELSTGFAVVDVVGSFFVGKSMSLLFPFVVLSTVFAAALVWLYEIRHNK
jgi:hypothetical protein